MFTYRQKPIHFGTNTEDGRPVKLNPDWLPMHVHILGSTGVGKTMFMNLLWKDLIRRRDATVILMTNKGDLALRAREAVITAGLTSRLVEFDTSVTERVIGYNPLRENGLPNAVHAKAVREGIRSASGESSFDGMPQLARFLFLALCAVRELGLTLVEAVQILRAGSPLRAQVVGRLEDPFIRESLEYFDSLKEQRQEELAASSLARLEAFVQDPTIRRILTQQERGLDIGEVIESRSILNVHIPIGRPLRLDDVRLLGRFLINDIVSHVYSRSGPRTPVFLMIDECHIFATQDLCLALDQGRELGLSCILAHQYPQQLLREDPNGLLYASVRENARTKVVFGGMSVETSENLAKELFLGEFDPLTVKDEITALELEPVESTRASLTVAESESQSHSKTTSSSKTTGQTTGRTDTEGTSESEGTSDTEGDSWTDTDGYSDSQSTGEALVIREDEDGGLEIVEQSSEGSSSSSQTSYTTSRSHTTSRSTGTHKSVSQSASDHKSQSKQRSRSVAQGVGHSRSVAVAPFYEYVKRERVTSRTFESFEEFLIGCLKKLTGQPRGHFVLKTPTSPPVYVRAPFVTTPFISARRISQALERVFSRPIYATPAEIDAEEHARRLRLMPRAGSPARSLPHAAKALTYKRKKD